MFTIPVGDLINSYDGDSKIFSFDGEVFDGFYEDLKFLKPLLFTIKLIVIEDGIHGIFTNFSDEILDEWMKLLNETTTRDAFAHNSREYYKTFLQEL